MEWAEQSFSLATKYQCHLPALPQDMHLYAAGPFDPFFNDQYGERVPMTEAQHWRDPNCGLFSGYKEKVRAKKRKSCNNQLLNIDNLCVRVSVNGTKTYKAILNDSTYPNLELWKMLNNKISISTQSLLETAGWTKRTLLKSFLALILL